MDRYFALFLILVTCTYIIPCIHERTQIVYIYFSFAIVFKIMRSGPSLKLKDLRPMHKTAVARLINLKIIILALLLRKLSCLGTLENLVVSTLATNSYSDFGVDQSHTIQLHKN